MTTTILRVRNLSKSISGKNLFTDANFDIKKDDCIGIIGSNGSGKTTFFRIILKNVYPDDGEIYLTDNLNIRYLSQCSDGILNYSVNKFIKYNSYKMGIKQKIEKLESNLSNPEIYNTYEYNEILEKIEKLNELAFRKNNVANFDTISKTLDKLNLKDIHPNTKLSTLSGGERQKLFLSAIFSNLTNNDLLLLDEPTNNLDIESIEWLERKIADFNGPVLIITHDRYLLDNLADKIVDIDNGEIVFYENTYEEFEEQKKLRQKMKNQEYKKYISNLKKQKNIIEKLSRRNRYDMQISSKTKRLKKIKKIENPIFKDYIMKVNFENVFKSGKNISDGVDICKKYDDNLILDNANYEIFSGQKIGLIGPNGCGKTTFLKIIIGKESIEKGKINISRGVKFGYFDQEHLSLDLEKNLISEVISEQPGLKETDAKALLGQLNFTGLEIYKKIRSLSGGEKARIALLKLLMKPYNFLILDEPTNHIDMQSRESIEKALNAYNGTIIIASHDRRFLDNVVDTIFIMNNYKIKMYKGNYTQSRFQRQNEILGTPEEDKIDMYGENICQYIVKKSFNNWITGKKFVIGEKILIGDHNKEKFEWAIKSGRLKIAKKR